MDTEIYTYDNDRIKAICKLEFGILGNNEIKNISALGKDTNGIEIPDLYDGNAAEVCHTGTAPEVTDILLIFVEDGCAVPGFVTIIVKGEEGTGKLSGLVTVKDVEEFLTTDFASVEE